MMRDCDFYEIHLAAYAAGDMADGERELLTAHLDTCDACRAELAREMDLRLLLGELPAARCPDAVSRSLHEILDLDAPQVAADDRRSAWAWIGPAGVVAAALVALLLVPGLRDGAPPTPQAAQEAYSEAEVAQARREVLAVLALTADVLDRSSGRTMSNVFGDRLPEAVSGSLRSPHAPDAHTPNSAHSASDNGGQG